MAWINDAHRQWHSIHGQMQVCPLDCGVTERYYEDEEDYLIEQGATPVKCGKCKGRHAGARGVATCHGFGA